FLILPPPPRPTLFPYTTLFRSLVVGDEGEAKAGDGSRPVSGSAGRPGQCEQLPRGLRRVRRRADGGDDGDTADPRGEDLGSIGGDRKSTRLNSSHSQISYAVFC